MNRQGLGTYRRGGWIAALAGGLLLLALNPVWSQVGRGDQGQPGGQLKTTAAGKPQLVAADPEEEAMLPAARSYVRKHSAPEAKFKLKLVKRAGNWALLRVIPVRPFVTDEAMLIMEKTPGGWAGRTLGTSLEDWEQRLPELFR